MHQRSHLPANPGKGLTSCEWPSFWGEPSLLYWPAGHKTCNQRRSTEWLQVEPRHWWCELMAGRTASLCHLVPCRKLKVSPMIFHDLQALGSFSPSHFPDRCSSLSICKVIESHSTCGIGSEIHNTWEEQNEGLLCLLSSWMHQTTVWCQLHWPTGWCM